MNDVYKGWNTDGAAVIEILSERCVIADQTIVILGAGGAARAIAYHARMRGASVIVMNRTEVKADAFSKEFGCTVASFDTLSQIRYTVLINTLPESAFKEEPLAQWLEKTAILEETIILDIVYQPIQTCFLKAMQRVKQGVLIPGYEMYVEQALMQLDRWFKPSKIQREEIHRRMCSAIR